MAPGATNPGVPVVTEVTLHDVSGLALSRRTNGMEKGCPGGIGPEKVVSTDRFAWQSLVRKTTEVMSTPCPDPVEVRDHRYSPVPPATTPTTSRIATTLRKEGPRRQR
jgi:hypothetical protein